MPLHRSPSHGLVPGLGVLDLAQFRHRRCYCSKVKMFLEFGLGRRNQSGPLPNPVSPEPTTVNDANSETGSD